MATRVAWAADGWGSARLAAAIALMVSLLFEARAACAGFAALMVVLVLVQASAGRTFWIPARWELFAVLTAGALASAAGWGIFPVLAAIGAVIAASDAQDNAPARWRLLAQPAMLGGAIWIAAGIMWIAPALFGHRQFAPAASSDSWIPLAAALLGLSAGGAAVLFGVLPRGWRLLPPAGITGLAVLTATVALSPSGAAMAICGSAAACLLCLGMHRRQFARRWLRWMFLIGLWSCMGVIGMRTAPWLRASIGPADAGRWSDAGSAGPAIAAFLALGTLFTLAKHLRMRTCGGVEAAGAFAALAGALAGFAFADPFLQPALLFAIFFLIGAPAWIRRPVPPAHMMQLCLDYGWVRISIVGEGMRRLLRIGITFGTGRANR